MEIKNKKGDIIFSIDGPELGVDLCDCDLKEACFSGVIMEGVWFMGANLANADFSHADLYWANFIEANMQNASLVKTDLRGSNLSRADLRNADLTEANFGLDNLGGYTDLQGTDLRGAIVHQTNFEGAVYDNDTKFSKQFIPADHGLVHINDV